MDTPLAPVENIDQIAKALTERALALSVITDETTYRDALAEIKENKEQMKRFVEFMEPIRSSQRAALDVTLGKIKGVKEMFEANINRLSPVCIAWQERAQREHEAEVKKANAALPKAERALAPVFHAYQEPEGLATRSYWSAEVVDLMKLVKAVAKGDVPLSYLEANTAALNKRAQVEQDKMKLPGVKAVEKKGFASAPVRKAS